MVCPNGIIHRNKKLVHTVRVYGTFKSYTKTTAKTENDNYLFWREIDKLEKKNKNWTELCYFTQRNPKYHKTQEKVRKKMDKQDLGESRKVKSGSCDSWWHDTKWLSRYHPQFSSEGVLGRYGSLILSLIRPKCGGLSKVSPTAEKGQVRSPQVRSVRTGPWVAPGKSKSRRIHKPRV